ncbi:hypothetical protein FH972_024888 [Carpinus fangiana]|uniref:aminodeoxychorismate synthase n=1 Tax=Carpinus fangiana TaxID=176857 RepID=A0A5N6L0B8_9ROSI|nr:hypothetical protein FH972_024888 [Carpinus fangiana]
MNTLADLGLYGLDGYTTTKRSEIPHIDPVLNHTTIGRLAATVDNYEFLIHPGDFAYADDWIEDPTNYLNGKNAYTAIIESFYTQLAPITARKPYLVSPGNHEADCQEVAYFKGICPEGQYNFSDFTNRFEGTMPTAFPGTGTFAAVYARKRAQQLANPPFWYSFDYGSAHIVMINTETDFPSAPDAPGGSARLDGGPFGAPNQQLQFLEADLSSVDRRMTPWVIVAGHRPWYTNGGSSTPCAPCKAAFEGLFYKYGVDVGVFGHVHNLQRFAPIYNGTVDPAGLHNPKAPMYTIIGGSGNIEGHSTITPKMTGNVFAYNSHFGYGSLTFHNRTHLGVDFWASPDVVKIDDLRLQIADKQSQAPAAFHKFLERFDAVIAGPGPGNPCDEEDVGLIRHLWAVEPPIPVLGICLGFQSLALGFGATIRRLKEPRHGMQVAVSHFNKSIYADAGDIRATLYNSLHIDLGRGRGHDLWNPTAACPDLVPLAWVLGDKDNGDVCVAVQHASKPFWGVQYHPESICTNPEGAKVFVDWWREVENWTRCNTTRPLTPRSLSTASSRRTSEELDSPTTHNSKTVQWEAITFSNRSVTWSELESWLPPTQHVTLLESGTRRDGEPVNPETGRFSILSCTDMKITDRFEYYLQRKAMRHVRKGQLREADCSPKGLLPHLHRFIQGHKADSGPPEVPFWGGLVGFISYEACLGTIDVQGKTGPTNRPDACFAFVDRSIVIDHVKKQLFVQSIRPADSKWIKDTKSLLAHNMVNSRHETPAYPTIPKRTTPLRLPTEASYRAKVERCKERIREGHSYELCLTDQNLLTLPPHDTPRNLYHALRKTNPAPFAALLSLPCSSATTLRLLSSSPERFLNWTRAGTCQFRPIKGTVKKTPGMTRARATALLQDPKEQAENLMIVDLIRHDLHGALGHASVRVKQLMAVEEYASVFQLVSVIEGQLAGRSGIEVLGASLPPGSMTGAPKKRSCELLQEIETQERGVYSGVLGYLDVGGGGDFSVVIRTAVSWLEDGEEEDEQEWKIGAGGAVTIQSTSLGEFEEMEAKRDALLSVFGGK